MSLDAPGDESAEETWSDKIVRRVAQVRDGEVRLLNREELCCRLKGCIENTQNGTETETWSGRIK
ncbi:MAG: addiction module protein [Alcanivorax sp.]|nr:addiction module protein [Alcanivorax sp.]